MAPFGVSPFGAFFFSPNYKGEIKVSIRISSDEDKVTLFDSVTGMAFGPVFDNADEASEYVDYVADRTGKDPREFNPNTLQQYKADFDEMKADNES